MAELQDIKAFLVTVRLGSFSAAGRELSLSPSVMTKRVSRLEYRMGAPLLERSTRSISLTTLGEKVRPKFQLIVGELEEVLDGGQIVEGDVQGHLRIKAPQSITSLYIGGILVDFLAQNPKLSMNVVTLDRSVNPVEEGYDLTIGALSSTYANVEEISLCHYDRVLCASPAYLEKHGIPKSPGELIEHDCLNFTPAGPRWSFVSGSGTSSIEIFPKFETNDSSTLVAGALQGVGVAITSRFLARPHLRQGDLTELMPAYPVSPIALKVLIPVTKKKNAAVKALVAHLQDTLSPIPPWEMDLKREAGLNTKELLAK